MSWASVGNRGSANTKASGTTLSLNPTADIPAGAIVVAYAVSDNIGTTDTGSLYGPGLGEHTVTDSKGNKWHFVSDARNGNAAANAGVTGSYWICTVGVPILTTDTVTLTLPSAVAAKALGIHEFSVAAGKSWSLGNVTSVVLTVADATVTGPSRLAPSPNSLAAVEHLWLAVYCLEGPTGDVYTADPDYTAGTDIGTSGGTADTNVTGHFGFHIASTNTDTHGPVTNDNARDWAVMLCVIDEVRVPVNDGNLRPSNSIVADATGGADIRVLDDRDAGGADITSKCTFTNADDTVNRTFDPASTIATVLDPLAAQILGWALPLSSMMPPDPRGKAVLPAGDATFSIWVNMVWTGGTGYTGTVPIRVKASLWKWNLDTNANTLIATATDDADLTWAALPVSESGTSKNAVFDIAWASDAVFERNEVLKVQFGFTTGTVPDPLSGTTTFTASLSIMNAGFLTGMLFNDTSLRTLFVDSFSIVQGHVVTRGAFSIVKKSFNVVQGHIVSFSRRLVLARAFNVVQGHVVSRSKVVPKRPFAIVQGHVVTFSRQLAFSRSFSVIQGHVVTRGSFVITKHAMNVVQGHVVSQSRSLVLSRSFNIIQGHVVTLGKRVTFDRRFNVVSGHVVRPRVEIDFDEVPEATGGVTVIRKIFSVFSGL